MKLLPFILLPMILLAIAVSVPTEIVVVNGSTNIESKATSVREASQRGEVKSVSAYTVGNPYETDDTPCIGASGMDLCELVERGVRVYASNGVPLRSWLIVDGEVGIVLDRMNRRYKNGEVDIAMLDRGEALEFGRKHLEVVVLK